MTGVVAISSQAGGVCGVLQSGGARCQDQDDVEAYDIVGVADANAVAAGSGHGCALKSTGEVACWGRGDMGQLGDGTLTDSSVATAVAW